MGKRLKGPFKNRKKMYIISIILLVIILSAGFVFYKGYSFLNVIHTEKGSKTLQKPKKEENINVLFVGIDAGKFADWDRKNDIGRTDTIIVASFDEKHNQIHLLSIPRDTRVKINGKDDKINAAFPLGGIDQSIKSVSDLLNIPIHHYVQVDYASFIETVDILDGVTVNVDKEIKYSINIPPNTFTPGVQTLKGKKAFYFVQARNSDLDRVKRQQVFLKALFSEIKKTGNIIKIPTILESIKNDIKTDMKPGEIVSLSNTMKNIPTENMQTYMIPGSPQYIGGVSYYLPDYTKIKQDITNLKLIK